LGAGRALIALVSLGAARDSEERRHGDAGESQAHGFHPRTRRFPIASDETLAPNYDRRVIGAASLPKVRLDHLGRPSRMPHTPPAGSPESAARRKFDRVGGRNGLHVAAATLLNGRTRQ
jgi:hypothetical protein